MPKLSFRIHAGETLEFLLRPGRTRLGRNPGNEIVIDNTWISSFHARLDWEGKNVILRDLDSSNGTRVNGERIQEKKLEDGDEIAFGQMEAVYEAADLLSTPAVAAPARPAPVSPLAPKPKAPPPVSVPAPAAVPAAAAGPGPVKPRAMTPPPATVAYDQAIREVKEELETHQRRLKDLQEEIRLLTDRRAQEQKALSELEETGRMARAEAEREGKRLGEELEAARAEAKTSREKLEKELTEAAKAAAERQLEWAALEKALFALREEQSLATAELDQAHTTLAPLRQEQATLESALREQQSRVQELKEEREVLESEVAALTQEKTTMTAEVADFQPQALEARAGLELLRAEVESARASVQELERERVRRGEEISAGERQLAQIHSELEEKTAEHQQRREGAIADQEAAQEATRHAREELAALTARRREAEGILAGILEETAAKRRDCETAGQELIRKEESLGQLREEQEKLALAAESWKEGRQKAQEQEALLREAEVALAGLREEGGALEKRIAAATDEMREMNSTLAAARESLVLSENRHRHLLGELQELQLRRDQLRTEADQLEPLAAEVARLHQEQANQSIAHAQDPPICMPEAPDPNWGTVHSFALRFIRKLDVIDDLLANPAHLPETRAALKPLETIRDGLLEILREYTIESYTIAPGTVLDDPARKRVQIVETLSGSGKGVPQVVRTCRPGYVCFNGDLGISTLLRKADVAVAAAAV